MSDQATAFHADGQPDFRAVTTVPPLTVKVMSGGAVPVGQRVLRIECAHGVFMFPLALQDAIEIGRALTAPGVVTPVL